MSVSDLTGTKWLLNSNLTIDDVSIEGAYYLNFNSNLHSYIILDVILGIGEMPEEDIIESLNYDTEPLEGNAVYGASPDIPETYIWYDEAYRTIEITGGTDATNADLISWLESNATQIVEPTITDLTGYTWVGNSSPTFTNIEGNTFDIILTSDNIDFEGLHFPTSVFDDNLISYGSDKDEITVYESRMGGWQNEAYKTITIAGGTDATNSTLIQWLQENGTLTAPSPTVNPSISIGTLSLSKAFVGNSEISQMWLGNTKLYQKETASGYEVELDGGQGNGEVVYVQINDDPTWYEAYLSGGGGFNVMQTNIPNVYEKTYFSIGIANVSKIKIGTGGDPNSSSGPQYVGGSSTGDFVNLTFTSTGSSAPAYATGEITMTQDSRIVFEGDD